MTLPNTNLLYQQTAKLGSDTNFSQLDFLVHNGTYYNLIVGKPPILFGTISNGLARKKGKIQNKCSARLIYIKLSQNLVESRQELLI